MQAQTGGIDCGDWSLNAWACEYGSEAGFQIKVNMFVELFALKLQYKKPATAQI